MHQKIIDFGGLDAGTSFAEPNETFFSLKMWEKTATKKMRSSKLKS
jgi:hypothetical protein